MKNKFDYSIRNYILYTETIRFNTFIITIVLKKRLRRAPRGETPKKTILRRASGGLCCTCASEGLRR
ncbi:hypothetical protein HanIR_Chr12g0574111 [Helianthus annuus]|nr:hypothetical protein HanIR_Chr12g0574111 [Helianthus annuus]